MCTWNTCIAREAADFTHTRYSGDVKPNYQMMAEHFGLSPMQFGQLCFYSAGIGIPADNRRYHAARIREMAERGECKRACTLAPYEIASNLRHAGVPV